MSCLRRISILAVRFVDYLEALRGAPPSCARSTGGWPLHLDATARMAAALLVVTRLAWLGARFLEDLAERAG